jgi:PhzF family phenazine biosynthesis protein
VRRLFQVDAFTRTRFEGNPAGVVLDAEGLTDRQMQAIARELNNSETAFVLPPRGGDHDVHVRFFTPTVEVPVCGHATIAAHFVRALVGEATDPRTRQLTRAGVIDVEIERPADGDVRIWMRQRPAEFTPPLDERDRSRLLQAMGLSLGELGSGPIQIVSTGHSKVIVPVASRAVLDRLRPDSAALTDLSSRIGCNGYYVHTTRGPDPGVTAHARMFAPAIGILEDPVTGNGAGPLGAYLVANGLAPGGSLGAQSSFVVRQGEALGRPGLALVTVNTDSAGRPEAVRVGGDAVVAFQSTLCL